MKTSLIILSLLFLTSCGKMPVDFIGTFTPNNPVKNSSILSKFQAVTAGTGLHGLDQLDFSAMSLNTPIDVSGNCNGTAFGNVGNVGGVPQGHVEIKGDDDSGFIQYGHLNYLTPLDQLCKDMSKEKYSYKVKGKILTLCMVNYPYCATYKKI